MLQIAVSFQFLTQVFEVSGQGRESDLDSAAVGSKDVSPDTPGAEGESGGVEQTGAGGVEESGAGLLLVEKARQGSGEHLGKVACEGYRFVMLLWGEDAGGCPNGFDPVR